MENGQSGLFVVFLLLLLGAGIFWPRAGLAALARRQWVRRRRELFEDALKHILAWEGRAENATRESLAGALEISQRRTLGLIARMEAQGLVQTVAGGISVAEPPQLNRMVQALRASGGSAVAVKDDEILRWQRLLAKSEGVFAESSAAAALAGLEALVAQGAIGHGDTVLWPVTGFGLKESPG